MAGAERITYAEVRAEARLARDAQAWHLKSCSRCHNVAESVYQRCDEGWALAKRVHRAEYALGRWHAAKDEGQPTLF